MAKEVEALLFLSPEPVDMTTITNLFDMDEEDVEEIIRNLNSEYKKSERIFHIERIDMSFQFSVDLKYSKKLKSIFTEKNKISLTRSNLEVLAIIAYYQPITRLKISDIRGAMVDSHLKKLMTLGLVRIIGKSEEFGKPCLYGTTDKFLITFGLASLRDLPKLDELIDMYEKQ